MLYGLLIPKVISMQEEVDIYEVFNRYKRCIASSGFVSKPEGQKILTLILTSNKENAFQTHIYILRSLSSATLAQGSAFGKVYVDALSLAVKTKSEELLKALRTCFSDLIIMAVKGRKESLVAVLRKLLLEFHKRKEPSLSKMIYNAYRPVAWRYMAHHRPLVRANTAKIFFDAFPIEDPDEGIVIVSHEFNDQMLWIKDLLVDDFPIVRSTAITELCIVLSVKWELFPEDMLSTYFKIIVNDVSCDPSSADVRLSVAKGFKVLLKNPLALPTMQVILPQLKPLFHDISDPVRIAFCHLLLRVKKIPEIKVFNIVPIENLIARMEDSVIAKLIVNLIYKSYFPEDEGPDGWLKRCVEMIKQNQAASRVLFQYAPGFIGIDATAQFMIHAVKVVYFYAVGYKQSVKNATTKKKLDGLHNNMKILEDTGFHDPKVVPGLLDAATIMWQSSLPNLKKPENKNMLELIKGKLAKRLAVLTHHYQDTSIWESIYYLSSFMPSSHIPSLASLYFVRLKALDSSAVPQDYMTLLECLCNYNESSGLIMLFKEWIEMGFQLPADKPPATKKCKSENSIEPVEKEFNNHFLAVEMLIAILNHQSCKEVVLTKHPELLKDLLNFTDHLKRKVELSLEKNICKEDEIFLRKLLFVLLRISMLLGGQKKYNSVKFVEDILLWIELKLLRPTTYMRISLNASAEQKLHSANSASFEQFIFEICEGVCRIITDISLAGLINLKSLKFLKFGMKLLSLDFGGKLLCVVCHLLSSYVTYGLRKINEKKYYSFKFVPDSFNKIIQCLNEDFLQAVPITDSKDAQKFLAESLLLMQPQSSLKELVSSVITMVAKTILNSILDSAKDWDDIEKKCDPFQLIPLSKSGAFLLSVMSIKPRIKVHFLKQLRKHLNSGKDIQSWVACYVIVVNLLENKNLSKTIGKEIRCLVAAMKRVLRKLHPLKGINAKLPFPQDISKSSKGHKKEISFGKHCHFEYEKLEGLLKKAKIKVP